MSDLRSRSLSVIGTAISEVGTGAKSGKSTAEICQIAAKPFTGSRIPLSTSPAGMFFRDWAENNKEECADGLRCWFGMPTLVEVRSGNNYSIPLGRLRSWIRGALVADPLPDPGIPSEFTINDLRRDFERTIADQKQALQSNLTASHASRLSNEKDQAAFAALVVECREAFSKLEIEFQGKMVRQEKFYKDKLAVHSAVEYWSNRSSKHEALSRSWGIASAFLLVVAAIALLCFFPAFVAPSSSPAASADEATVKSTVAGVRDWLGSATRFGLAVAFFVWPLRIFVRNYLSNAHLATDAAERAVIVQTYLALLNDEQLQDDADLKKLMLGPVIESMFRHASDGIVKDDGIPWQPAMFAEIMKNVSPPK